MNLKNICLEIRQEIARHGYLSGRGHISSSLSLVEILAALYFSSIVDVEKIKNDTVDRDRIILSKGHGGLAFYVVLMKANIMDRERLSYFATAKGKLSTHPVFGDAKGVEMSAGSLGQGLGFACGVALSGKLSHMEYKTYVIVGDGELQEGSNWESMLFASQMKLDNLTVIVDKNKLQISGLVDNIVSIHPLSKKLESFGFEVIEVDGHNLEAMIEALKAPHDGCPKAIIANTVKGKGLSFMEGKNGWHGKGLTLEQYNIAMKDLAGVN